MDRLDAVLRAPRRRGAAEQQARKAIEPVDAGGKAAQPLEVIEDHGHGRQHRGERAGGLDRTPHLQLARQHARGDHHAGQDQREKAEAVLEETEIELRTDHFAEVRERRLEVILSANRLVPLAAHQRDRPGMLADAHQRKAEIGLAPQLQEVESDQRPAEHTGGEHVAGDRVHHQHRDQLLGDRPEHTRERDELDGRAQPHQQEVERLVGERTDVFRYALIGVVDAAARIEFVVHAVAQVRIEKVAGEPAPPAQRELVARVVVEGVERHRDDQRDRALHDGRPESIGVLRRQRRSELARLRHVQHVEAGLREQQQHQHRQQCARARFFIRTPVRPRDRAEPSPEQACHAHACFGRGRGIGLVG